MQGGVLQREPVGLDGDALATEQAADDADGLVLTVAKEHRIDPEAVSVRSQRARSGPEDHPSARHVVELHDPLSHVVRMVVRQGHHPGGELDTLRSLARRGEEHFRRRDHLPPAGMMLAAPEFVVPKLVQALNEVEVAAELQHRMLADGMVGGEKRAEVQTWHGQDSRWMKMEQRCKADSAATETMSIGNTRFVHSHGRSRVTSKRLRAPVVAGRPSDSGVSARVGERCYVTPSLGVETVGDGCFWPPRCPPD